LSGNLSLTGVDEVRGAAVQWWRCLGHERRADGGQGRKGGAVIGS
jgi:hypothetical protein